MMRHPERKGRRKKVAVLGSCAEPQAVVVKLPLFVGRKSFIFAYNPLIWKTMQLFISKIEHFSYYPSKIIECLYYSLTLTTPR